MRLPRCWGVSTAERLTLLLATVVAAATAACATGGTTPMLEPIDDQLVQVGTELRLELRASDADGDALDFSFAADVPGIHDRAALTRSPAGTGVFRWTPMAADVGLWHFDFVASDGAVETTLPVAIEVRSAVGAMSAPVFRAPLGSGTTLDLGQRQCAEVAIAVDDPDSTDVVLAEEEPRIEGAVLDAPGGVAATWRWCPSQAQANADDRFPLTLSADDGANPKTLKSYLIVLRRPGRPDCPGAAPTVEHTPADAATLVGLTVDARIRDDRGLKRAPLFYYATTPPADPPDLARMTQLSMLLIDGDMTDGVWAADVPNPVATAAAGTTADLYYVIVADDDDDAAGRCDHSAQAPARGTYQMRVTNPGGHGDADLCAACTASIQCGDGDLCVRVGAAGGGYCLEACAGDADCPAGTTCSPDAVTAIDGGRARQCVPTAGTCSAAPACSDDAFEDNDSRAQAASAPPLAPDLYEATSCPRPGIGGDDEDWYPIVVDADATVTLELSGSAASDLDLGLYDSAGGLVAASTSLSSTEAITTCLDAGTYFVRVHAYGAAANEYLLQYRRSPGRCDAVCRDDAAEPDDRADQARVVDASYQSTGDAICAGDDDWYQLYVFNGDRIRADLTFTQTRPDQDLDFHFYNVAGNDLTPCSEAAPSTCSAGNGQSADSDEHFENPITAGCALGCLYYLVVRGYAGSSNSYDIRIEVP